MPGGWTASSKRTFASSRIHFVAQIRYWTFAPSVTFCWLMVFGGVIRANSSGSPSRMLVVIPPAA